MKKADKAWSPPNKKSPLVKGAVLRRIDDKSRSRRPLPQRDGHHHVLRIVDKNLIHRFKLPLIPSCIKRRKIKKPLLFCKGFVSKNTKLISPCETKASSWKLIVWILYSS